MNRVTKSLKIRFNKSDGSTLPLTFPNSSDYVSRNDIIQLGSAAIPVLNVQSIKEAYFLTSIRNDLDIK